MRAGRFRLLIDNAVILSGQSLRGFRPAFIGLIALGLSLILWFARPLHSENFVVYLPSSRHVLPLTTIEQGRYLQLMHVLNLVGKVGALQERRKTLKVWFGEAELELREDDPKIRVNRTGLSLAAPVRVRNGQWMIPVDFLPTVLPHLTGEAIEYQVGTNRIFIGNVNPASFSVRLDRIPGGARLSIRFTDKVTMRTAASDGKWILFLGDRAVEPLESTFRFPDPYISELKFDDQDGYPKLIITPAAGGLNFYPTLAEEGEIILADVLKPPPGPPPIPGAPAEAPPAVATVPEGLPVRPGEESTELITGPRLPLIVLDAGHGGTDLGARSRDMVLEKDLVAQLVARVRWAVLNTGKFRVVLTRVGDASLTFDERDVAANRLRPRAFLTFHAGDHGGSTPRVVVYSYQAPSQPLPPATGELPWFVPWTRAQLFHRDASRDLASAVSQHLAQIQDVTVDEPQEAPVRALRSVYAPAVAIEVGSLAPAEDASVLTQPAFQNKIAGAIARALVTFGGGTS